jgi:cobyrinic acid a,c-diamide synthase
MRPLGVQGLYLGGGYPELYAEALDRSQTLRIYGRRLAERSKIEW